MSSVISYAVVIISALSLAPSVPKHESRCQTTTYPDTFDELGNTRYDDKGTKKGNCPRPLGYVWEEMSERDV